MPGNTIRAIMVFAAGFAIGWLPPIGRANGWAGAPLQADAYAQFNAFCAQHFGAEHEEEYYRMVGAELRILDESSWKYASEASACIAWQTNLPAKGYVEYGLDSSYGHRTAEPERHFSLHLHHLKDLRPETTYHYRLVCTDERGRRINSSDFTIATRRFPEAVRIPDDLSGPPYVLDKPETLYVLTRDIVADTTGVNIVANGVTLDLGGHSLVYDEKAGTADPSANERVFGWHAAQNPCGIRTADRKSGLTIVNGIVRQGAGKSASRPCGFNPLFLRRPQNTEIAGLIVEYSGSQVSGMMIDSDHASDKVHVHHNVIADHGTELYNRHLGVDAIRGPSYRCHHNLVTRTRHRGITVGPDTEVYANEIYVDSYATNSYGIMYYNNRGAQNLILRGNRVFGTGFHPIGIGSGQGYSDVKVCGNYIQMQGTAFERRWISGVGGGDPEDQRSPVNGLRLQRPRRNVEHYDNVVVVKGHGEGCEMRGLWLVPDQDTGEGIVLRNNVVKLIAEDHQAAGYAIACCGAETEKPTVTLLGNTVISNLQHIQCGDSYGFGKHFRFVSNTFVRTGNDPRYRTIRLGWQGWKHESFGHWFINTTLLGGASFESVAFDGAGQGKYDFSVGWQLKLIAPPGTLVSIADGGGTAVYSGKMPGDGMLVVPLTEYVRTSRGKTPSTPHTVTLSSGGKTATRVVVMDRNREVTQAD